MTKKDMKKEFYARINASNILKSQNIILDDNIINTYLAFFNDTVKEETKKEYTDIIEFITELNIHKCFTVSIIKSIASNPQHFCNKSCMDIVNSGYTQHILEDIESNVFIALFEMVQNKHCKLEENKIVFDTYINSKDKETSYFVKLYRVIENTFYSEKKHNEERFTKIKYDVKKHGKNAFYDDKGYLCDRFGNTYLQGCKFEYLDSYNNDETSVNGKDYKEYLYSIVGENELQNIAFRDDVKRFFSILKEEYPKYYSDFCNIFHGLYRGYTYKEISEFCGISERRIKYLIPLFREKYNQIMIDGITLEKNKTVSLYSDTTRNKGCKTYINRGIMKNFVIPRITVSHKEEKMLFDNGNYDYDIPQWQKDEWKKEREKKQKEIYNNATKYINVYDSRNKCIVVLDDNGNKLFSLNASIKGNIKKVCKKNGIEIL